MDKVKVALIGAGGMANMAHYPSLTSFEDVLIVGLCDLNEKRLAETAARFAIASTFTDYRQMLDRTRPDAVYVLMPPYQLFDVAMDVIDGGFALFVEKPPAINTDQTVALANRAEQKNVITGVGFQRRYHPLAVHCHEQVRQRGRIHQVVSAFYKNMAPSERNPYYRGAIDILRSDAIHAVDAMRYFAGRSAVRAVASDVRRLDCSYHVSFNALVTFENNVLGVLLANWRSGRRLLRFEFHGYGACAFVDADGDGTVWADDKNEPVLSTTYTQVGTDHSHVNQGFSAEGRAFIDAVKSGKPLHNNFRDAVQTMELADMIYRQVISNAECRVPNAE